MSGRFAKGHIPDPEGHRVTSFKLARGVGAPLPDSVDLTPFAPSPLDQNRTSSCVGHATACALATSFARAGAPLGFVPSPHSIYQLALCIDRPDPSVPLVDAGSMPNQAMRGLTEWGIRPMRAPSPQGYNSDCDPSNVTDEPKLADLEQDATAVIVGQYEISSATEAAQALAAGYAVTVASFVDTAFEELGPNSPPYDMPDETDPNGGGHYLFLVGYRHVAGKLQFRVQNSWGTTQWGDGGRCWVTTNFVNQCSDKYAMSVRKVAA